MKLKNLFKSFEAAGRGLVYTFKNEQNFRFQFFASILVLTLSIYFPLKNWEIILVILLVVAVLAMELLNTALEYFADLLKPRLNHYVLVVKDVMAAAVLVTALGALTIGLIIFLPHFLEIVK